MIDASIKLFTVGNRILVPAWFVRRNRGPNLNNKYGVMPNTDCYKGIVLKVIDLSHDNALRYRIETDKGISDVPYHALTLDDERQFEQDLKDLIDG